MLALPPGVTIEDLRAVRDAAGEGPIVVALSGGGDSTALLYLLGEGAPGRLIAGIIDHALRPGSRDDADAAAAIAARAGGSAEILRLNWPSGAKRTQAAFRAARYRALTALSQRVGARVIALGHTRDDQAETAAMRAARGAGGGMRRFAPPPLWPAPPSIMIARPLLGVRRAALRAWLTARDARWIEDPSNENCAYERVRLRRLLSDGEIERLAAAADEAERGDIIIDRQAAEWIAAHVRFDGPAISFAAAPPPRALGALVAAASGREQTPPRPAIARLAARIAAPGFRGASLGGARLRTAGGEIYVGRDPGAVLGRAGREGLAPLGLVETPFQAVWDGRLRVIAHEPLTLTADPDDPDVPLVRVGGRLFSLTEAEQAGLLSARWLLAEHVSHILFTPP